MSKNLNETTESRYTGQPFRLILPDQKRLREAFDDVMARAGLVFEKATARSGQGVTRDLSGLLPDIETYELRADAALNWVNDGAADIAIVGEDILRERQAAGTVNKAKTILTMDRVSACSLWFAAKPEIYLRDLSDLGDMRIATAYPELLQQILDVAGVKPSRIITQKGNTESTIIAGRADAILEIVQTGASLSANGLEKKLLAFNSAATLVRNDNRGTPERENLIAAFSARIEEVLGPKDAEVTYKAPERAVTSMRRVPAYLPAN